MTERNIRLTKFDAARRQLRTAIELWFADGDPVSIHTLAYASHEVIHRLFRNQGLKDLFFDSSAIAPEGKQVFLQVFKNPANFIKHANQEVNPDDEIKFSPFANDVYILFSLDGLRRMGREMERTDLAFLVWYQINNPEYFLSSLLSHSIPVDVVQQFRGLKRSEFLERFLKAEIVWH